MSSLQVSHHLLSTGTINQSSAGDWITDLYNTFFLFLLYGSYFTRLIITGGYVGEHEAGQRLSSRWP
jgi:hypothetical protein